MSEETPSPESETDVSNWLLEEGNFPGTSRLYEALTSQKKEGIPGGALTIDLDLTEIEDTKLLERITFDIKRLLENTEIYSRFSSVRIKIKRSQMNTDITNYRMAFPSKYEVIEDEP